MKPPSLSPEETFTYYPGVPWSTPAPCPPGCSDVGLVGTAMLISSLLSSGVNAWGLHEVAACLGLVD